MITGFNFYESLFFWAPRGTPPPQRTQLPYPHIDVDLFEIIKLYYSIFYFAPLVGLRIKIP